MGTAFATHLDLESPHLLGRGGCQAEIKSKVKTAADWAEKGFYQEERNA